MQNGRLDQVTTSADMTLRVMQCAMRICRWSKDKPTT